MRVKILYIAIGVLLCCSSLCAARDTVYVSGSVQHDGLFPTRDVSEYRALPRAKWAKIDHLSNNYIDLSVHYLTSEDNKSHFRGVTAATRVELNQWPLLGYEPGFAGHGIGHLSLRADFDWGHVSVGDIYGQFGSGMLLNLYENRDLGIDNSLRGAKITADPYTGIHVTLLGGKQRRYWNCYADRAWGWNYTQDAALGADLNLELHSWIKPLQDNNIDLTIGGSYVSKYEQRDTILRPIDGMLYMYNLPRWVGAGEVRAELQAHGWDVMAEYAYKANDPTVENAMDYRPGQALLLSAGYSRKGFSVLVQTKFSDNMSFRSARREQGIVGRLNLLPVFTPQHTYSLAALYPYATQYVEGEWAFQAEVCYTWPRKTPMGGRYGTTLKFSASHVRGLREPGSWAIDMSRSGTYYTDIHLELNKKVNKIWNLNALLMYQTYNQRVIEGEGDLVRAGVAVLENKVKINKNVILRNELQYLFTRQDNGQWVAALLELDLWHCVTLTGSWEYNIGGAPNELKQHYYYAGATYSNGAHHLSAGYVKSSGGFNCSGGVCRMEPEQEGVKMSYNYTW